VRVIDGRATNGHFWLLYAALAKAEVGIEIVDRATGNTRRFMKPAGEPAGGIELEALSPAAAVVHTTLDPARAVTAAIGPAGGALQAVDAHGTTFRLVVPKNALISLQDVTLTPVATIGDLPFSGGLAGAVYLEPAGFVMSESAQLTITPSPALARAQQLSFAFRGLAGELALAPPVLGPAALVLPVHHFGGYGVGSGTAADLAAQLARVPTRLEDRLTQRLAGILLPIRRAANGAALPASVLQLLQQDYTASIKPNLVKLKLGGLEASYPVVRNWQNTAKDTAQSAKLQTQLQEIQSAEIAGGVASYNAAAAAAVAADAAVDPTAARPCKNVKAAERMFRAYALLKARGKQGLVARQKLDNCARFTVKWNTLLDWRPPSAPNMHQDVEVGMVLTWHESDGSFWFIKRSKVNEERITQPECNVFFLLEKVGEPTVSNVLLELRLRAFTWSDDLLSDLEPPSLHYEFDPGANQDWRVTCTQHYPPLPQIGPITADFSSSWSGNYTFFHTAELDGHGFRARLEQSASPGVFAEKVYNRGTDIEYFEEHTLISVFFTPR